MALSPEQSELKPFPDTPDLETFAWRLHDAALYHGVTIPEVLARRGPAEATTARRTLVYLAREETDFTLDELGELLGNRPGKSIGGLYNQVKRELAVFPATAEQLQQVREYSSEQAPPIERVTNGVLRELRLDQDDLHSMRKTRQSVLARHLIAYLLIEKLHQRPAVAARVIGVAASPRLTTEVARFKRRLDSDKSLQELVARVENTEQDYWVKPSPDQTIDAVLEYYGKPREVLRENVRAGHSWAAQIAVMELLHYPGNLSHEQIAPYLGETRENVTGRLQWFRERRQETLRHHLEALRRHLIEGVPLEPLVPRILKRTASYYGRSPTGRRGHYIDRPMLSAGYLLHEQGMSFEEIAELFAVNRNGFAEKINRFASRLKADETLAIEVRNIEKAEPPRNDRIGQILALAERAELPDRIKVQLASLLLLRTLGYVIPEMSSYFPQRSTDYLNAAVIESRRRIEVDPEFRGRYDLAERLVTWDARPDTTEFVPGEAVVCFPRIGRGDREARTGTVHEAVVDPTEDTTIVSVWFDQEPSHDYVVDHDDPSLIKADLWRQLSACPEWIPEWVKRHPLPQRHRSVVRAMTEQARPTITGPEDGTD